MLGSLAITLLGVALTNLVWMTLRSWALCTLVAVHAAQGFFVFVQSALDYPTDAMGSSSIRFDLHDSPGRALFPLAVAMFAAATASVIATTILGPRNFGGLLTVSSLSDLSPGEERALRAFTLVTAALPLLNWVGLYRDIGAIGYPLRVTEGCLSFLPIAAGYYGRLFPRTRPVWAAVLAVNFTVSVILGERGGGFVPALYYAIGFVLSLDGKRRQRAALAFALAIPVWVYALARVGAMRDEIGRGGLELVKEERIGEVWDTLTTDLSGTAAESVLASQGSGRMIIWPNFAVSILSPDDIPYRGTGSWLDDIESYSRVGFFMASSREALYDGNLQSTPARTYGFTVNEFTSVDFGIVADGWSRAGPWGVVLATMALSFLLAIFEVGIERGARSRILVIMLLSVAIKGGFYSHVRPVLDVGRSLLLEGTYCIALFLLGRALSGLWGDRPSRHRLQV